MNRISSHKIAAVLILSAVTLSGCYTVLRHPPVQRESYLSSEITHRDTCNSCHRGFGVFSYKDPYKVEYPYTSEKLQDWNYFYHYPWWLDDVYYPMNSAEGDAENPLPIDPRRLGNRQGVGGYAPNAAPAPAGPGFLRKQSTGADSALKAPAIRKSKPKANRAKLKSETEKSNRTRKKKNN